MSDEKCECSSCQSERQIAALKAELERVKISHEHWKQSALLLQDDLRRESDKAEKLKELLLAAGIWLEHLPCGTVCQCQGERDCGLKQIKRDIAAIEKEDHEEDSAE